MANVKTYARRIGPSGQIGAVEQPWYYTTAVAERAKGGLGAGLAEIGQDIFAEQTKVQVTNAEADIQQRLQTFRSSLSQNTNPDTFLPLLEETFKQIGTEVVSNISRPRAKQEITAYLARLKPAFQADIEQAGRLQTKLNLGTAGDRALFEYLNGNPRDIRMNAEREMVVENAGKALADANMLWHGKDPSVVVADAKYQVAKNAVRFGALDIAEEGGYKAGEQFIMASSLHPADKEDLTRSLRAQIAAQTREIVAAKEALQDENARQLITDFWDGKLTDPQVITDLLKKDLITISAANSLRNALLDSKKPTLNAGNYIKVKEAISDLREGRLSRKQAIEVLYANLNGIDETTGKSLIGEIFTASEPDNPLNEATAKHLSETLKALRDSGSLMGKATADMTLDEKAQNEFKWLKLTIDLEDWLKKNPTATAEQKQKYFKEVLLKPQLNDAAKNWLQRAWEGLAAMNRAAWEGFPGTKEGPTAKKPIPEVSLRAQKRLKERISGKWTNTPDPRLDKYWGQLKEKQKIDIWDRWVKNPDSIDTILRTIESATP